jgi:16S rRNA (cytosine1402-N4)-methyltransferase
VNSEDSPQKPKRRPRYKGTHPRKFNEKYKELRPENYADDIKKIMSRGATPAGSHRPICAAEILEFFSPKPGDKILDATLGYGGHSSMLLEKILPGGTLIALDQDPIERPKTEARLREKFQNGLIIGGVNFSQSRNFLLSQGIQNVDYILADLGLSSMQIDNPSRGFTFKVDAPLDLRMNPQKGKPAFERLAELDALELETILREYSDEPHARQIATALVKARPKTTIETAGCIRKVVAGFSKNIRDKEGDTPIRRTFQALRIAVNGELAALEEFLADVPRILRPKGRVVILSFHSGEDRRVKKSFQAGLRDGTYSDIAPDPIRPSFEEQRANPRSKATKMRWAIKS